MRYCDLNECINSYQDYLLVKYPEVEKRFNTRCKSTEHKEGCTAEAAIFAFMQLHDYQIELYENPGTGGVDYFCFRDKQRLFLEVTTLKEDTIAKHSGWTMEIPNDIRVSSYKMITPKLRQKISEKASQLSDHDCPRVLAICSVHYASDVLLGTDAAERLLVGDSVICVSTGGEEDIHMVTHLADTAFLRFEAGSVVTCRKSISAILLVSIFDKRLRTVGVLHPDPEIEMPLELFPRIPFVRLARWSPEVRVIDTEWVQKQANVYDSFHMKIEIPEEDLRTP